jgi:hypothetical protein
MYQKTLIFNIDVRTLNLQAIIYSNSIEIFGGGGGSNEFKK